MATSYVELSSREILIRHIDKEVTVERFNFQTKAEASEVYESIYIYFANLASVDCKFRAFENESCFGFTHVSTEFFKAKLKTLLKKREQQVQLSNSSKKKATVSSEQADKKFKTVGR